MDSAYQDIRVLAEAPIRMRFDDALNRGAGVELLRRNHFRLQEVIIDSTATLKDIAAISS